MKKEWVKNDRSLEEFKTAVKTPGNTGDLGCVSLGESENGFVIRDHMDSSTPKKRKIRKRIILS